MSPAPRPRRLAVRPGFTLVEVLVYLGLVTSAMLVIGGVELAAHRAVRLQGALIDMRLQADLYLGRLRRDVEEARAVSAEGQVLVVELLDGRKVEYRPRERIERAAGEAQGRSEPFPLLESLQVALEPTGVPDLPRVVVQARFVRTGGDGLEVRRTFTRTAVPRREALR